MSQDRISLDELAWKLDQFAYDYDTYNYMDAADSREAGFLQVRSDLIRGNTEGIREFLSGVVQDRDSLDELTSDAESLLRDLYVYEHRGRLSMEEKNSILQQIETRKTQAPEKTGSHKIAEREKAR